MLSFPNSNQYKTDWQNKSKKTSKSAFKLRWEFRPRIREIVLRYGRQDLDQEELTRLMQVAVELGNACNVSLRWEAILVQHPLNKDEPYDQLRLIQRLVDEGFQQHAIPSLVIQSLRLGSMLHVRPDALPSAGVEAFLMGWHHRLGADSPIHFINKDLLRIIAEAAFIS